mgnify:CR=1 FL=1
MDSDSNNNYISRLRDRASNATQQLNAKIINSVDNLKTQFKAKLNFISVLVFIIVLIILVVFIIFSIYIPTKDFYFSIIQYVTVVIFFIILLTFYVINRPIRVKKNT